MLNKANLSAILNLTLGIILAAYPSIRIRTFSVLLGVGLGIEVAVLIDRRPKIRRRYLIAGLACFAPAHIFWIRDDRLIPCNPTSLLPGRAAWQLLTAVSTSSTFRYYLSDESGAA